MAFKRMAFSVSNIAFILNEAWINRTATCVKSTLKPPNPATSLESLPDEILVQIIDHLNQFDVLDLCLTNSRFYSLCMSKLFKRAFITLSDPDIKDFQDYAIFHRKLNTFAYTNSTILSGKYSSLYFSSSIDSFVNKFEIVEKEYRLPLETYMTIYQLEKTAFSNELLNRNSSIFRSKILKIKLSHHLGPDIEFIRSNRNIMCSFKKVQLSSIGLLGHLESVTQLQGIFSETNSLYLYSDGFCEAVLNAALLLFRCENIKELQLSYSGYYPYLVNSMPNLKTLVMNDDRYIRRCQFEQFSKAPLQNVCINVCISPQLAYIKEHCNLVKNLLNYFGSSLVIVKISITCQPTTLQTIDLFFYRSKYDYGIDYIEIKQEIRNLVDWIKINIDDFPKLQYFTFYNYSFVIDRQVEPCHWIELSRQEL